MSFLHHNSCECTKSELDLFSLPPTQTSIEGEQWVHYKPISSLSDDAPLEFVVPGHGDEYVDLSHTIITREEWRPYVVKTLSSHLENVYTNYQKMESGGDRDNLLKSCLSYTPLEPLVNEKVLTTHLEEINSILGTSGGKEYVIQEVGIRILRNVSLEGSSLLTPITSGSWDSNPS
ncbi:hypothetical protein J437_LFUL004736 [Ladona fulva]|uniref:Uncharacterized protein n=1 Tax=Ladona fulva TaxID=123851 RepID=A0A8K0P0E2_LADFU|nr:hypothetical protein J437_LFUL004736 [Ladona fulva]